MPSSRSPCSTGILGCHLQRHSKASKQREARRDCFFKGSTEPLPPSVVCNSCSRESARLYTMKHQTRRERPKTFVRAPRSSDMTLSGSPPPPPPPATTCTSTQQHLDHVLQQCAQSSDSPQVSREEFMQIVDYYDDKHPFCTLSLNRECVELSPQTS